MGQSFSSLPPSQIVKVMNDTDFDDHENSIDDHAGYSDDKKLLMMCMAGLIIGKTVEMLTTMIVERQTNVSESDRRSEGRDDLVGLIIVIPVEILTTTTIKDQAIDHEYDSIESMDDDDAEKEDVESNVPVDVESEGDDDEEDVESDVAEAIEDDALEQGEVEDDDRDDESIGGENAEYEEEYEEEAELNGGEDMENEKDNDGKDLESNVVNDVEDDYMESNIDGNVEDSEDDGTAESINIQSISIVDGHQVLHGVGDDTSHSDPFLGLKPKTTSLFCWGGHEDNDKELFDLSEKAPINTIRFIEDVMLNVYSFLSCRDRLVTLTSVDKTFLHDPARCGFKCVTIGVSGRTNVALIKFFAAIQQQHTRKEKEFDLQENKIASEPSRRKRYRMRRKLKKQRKYFDGRFWKLLELSAQLDNEPLQFVKAEEKFAWAFECINPSPMRIKYHEYDVLTERIREEKCKKEFKSLIIDVGIDWDDHDMGSLSSRTNYFLPDTGGVVKRFELLQCYGCSKVVPYDELGCRCNDHQHFECKTCLKKKVEDTNQSLTRYGGTCPMCLHEGHIPYDWDDWSSGGPRYWTDDESDYGSENRAEDCTSDDESDDDSNH